MKFRNGSHNARNIYLDSGNRDTDIHMGVMFTPEMAKTVVVALNEHFESQHDENLGAGSVYVAVSLSHASSDKQEEVAPGIILDRDKNGRPLGVEIIGAARVDINGREVLS